MNPFVYLFILCVLLLLSIFGSCQEYDIPRAQAVFSSKLYQSFLIPSNSSAEKEQAPENFVVSPFSIHTVLSMSMLGARNQTFNEHALALGFHQNATFISLNQPESTTQFEESITEYAKEWNSLIKLTNDSILSIANGIYIEKGYPLSMDYLSLIRDEFHSNVKSSDFSGNAENERVQINSFVSDRTNQLIEELIPFGAITSDTKLVLVNAIYFLGDWQSPFNKDMTSKSSFKQLSTSQLLEQQVDTMIKRDVIEMFGENDEHNWLTLPYSNPNYQMTFIVPKTNQPFTAASDKNFDQFIASSLASNSPVFTTTFTNMRQVKIPKFKIEFESELSTILKDENGDFKMVTSFERETANLTGMIQPDHPMKQFLQLWIDKIFHKAHIRVDEKGTEAAAATASIIVGRTTSIIDVVDQKDFIIDRPFAFVLKRDDVILFVGKVNKLF